MMVGTRSASRRHSVATAGESGSPAAGNSGMGETAGVREGGDSGGGGREGANGGLVGDSGGGRRWRGRDGWTAEGDERDGVDGRERGGREV
jgi:hypothetical protein